MKFSHVLCGRATWKDGIPIYRKNGMEAFRLWLKEEERQSGARRRDTAFMALNLRRNMFKRLACSAGTDFEPASLLDGNLLHCRTLIFYLFCSKQVDNGERTASRLQAAADSLLSVYAKPRPTQEPQVALCYFSFKPSLVTAALRIC